MARKASAADLQKAKEAKQKKLLLALLPVFLILAAWQGPKLYKEFLSPPAPEAEPAPVETAPAEPAPAEPGEPPPPGGSVSDSDPLPAAGSDRLISFSRFTGRDPFRGPTGYESSTGDAADPTSGVVPGEAVIELNGVQETVAVGGSFPASGPVFRLVSVTESGVTIGLVSGTFENGESTVEIAVGEQVDLIADPDGTRYTVRVVSAG
jgi:hypothetical protein